MTFQLHARAFLLALVATLALPHASCFRVVKEAGGTEVKEAASTEESMGSRRRRRRRSCGDWGDVPPRAERSVSCNTASPGACAKPGGYTIRRDEGSRTALGTFRNMNDARDNFKRDDGQMRMLLDAEGNEVDFGNNCGNRDEYVRVAKNWATEIDECKFPWGGWEQVWSELNPPTTYTHTEQVLTGRSFTQTDSSSITQSFKISIGQGPFRASAKFSNTVTSTSSSTWKEIKNVTRTWGVTKGERIVAWKYVLKTKCFNIAGQFLDEYTFATSIFTTTNETWRNPNCDPNTPGSC